MLLYTMSDFHYKILFMALSDRLANVWSSFLQGSELIWNHVRTRGRFLLLIVPIGGGVLLNEVCHHFADHLRLYSESSFPTLLDVRFYLECAAVGIGVAIGLVGYSVIISVTGERGKKCDLARFPVFTGFAAMLIIATMDVAIFHIIAVVLYYLTFLWFDFTVLDNDLVTMHEKDEVEQWRHANTVRVLAYILFLLLVILWYSVLYGRHPADHRHLLAHDLFNFVSGAIIFEIFTGSVSYFAVKHEWFEMELKKLDGIGDAA